MQVNNNHNAARGCRGGRGGMRGRGGMEGRGARGNRNFCTPDNAMIDRRITNEYCNTHGGCNHISGDCTIPAQGHNKTAMMENRLGGSNAVCQPCQE